MPKRNLFILVLSTLACLAAWGVRERTAAARRYGEVLAAIDRHALRPVAADELFDAAAEAVVGRLDEHSAYLRAADRDDLESALDQRFGGVGLELALDADDPRPVVVAPLHGGPAWRGGIGPGDVIEAIDGRPTAGRPLREAVDRLRGQPGEAVSLRVVSPTPPGPTLDPAAAPAAPPARDVRLVREVVEVESVQGDRRLSDGSWDWFVEGERGVALVRISSFGERTAAEFAAAAEAIGATPGLRGVVLDLRGNPGGLFQASVDVCDLLLDDGLIVATRGRGGAAGAGGPEERRAAAGLVLADVPMTVLVDGLTASAAEIVAACLQDSGRATIVGSRTFGKGTVQSLLPLSDGRGMLKLTSAEYLRRDGGTIHRRPGDGDDAAWGVRPDAGYEVTPTAEALGRLRDWRRRRDAAPLASGAASAAVAEELPREIDAVLARALEVSGGE